MLALALLGACARGGRIDRAHRLQDLHRIGHSRRDRRRSRRGLRRASRSAPRARRHAARLERAARRRDRRLSRIYGHVAAGDPRRAAALERSAEIGGRARRARAAQGACRSASATAMRSACAATRPRRSRIATISDLARRPALVFGLSEELLARADGWPALRAAYGLSDETVRGLDHDIAYKGLIDGAIDVVDLYTTDPQVADRRILVLDDDRQLLHRKSRRSALSRRSRAARAASARGHAAAARAASRPRPMIAMNVAVKTGLRSEREAAANFVAAQFGVEAPARRRSGLAERVLAAHAGASLSRRRLARRGDRSSLCRSAWLAAQAPAARPCILGGAERCCRPFRRWRCSSS